MRYDLHVARLLVSCTAHSGTAESGGGPALASPSPVFRRVTEKGILFHVRTFFFSTFGLVFGFLLVQQGRKTVDLNLFGFAKSGLLFGF